MLESRTRPCLQYQIKRCSAPCVGKISEAAYADLVSDAERFLAGKSTTVQADLAKAMAEASEAMEFERAAALRDRIRALTAVQSAQGINPRGVPEADVIAVHLDHGQACVQVFFIRANQSWGNRDFYPRTGSGAEEPEILQAFLTQFYDDKEPPRLILLSHPVEDPDLVAEALSARAGRKVELTVPQRGEKAELVENAARNARESLARRMAETGTQAKLLQGLAEAFDLEAPPQRIEIYDNAHIQGADAVGGMVVAGAEGFLKSQYRKFNIRGQAGANSDDFGMMREVLSRRFDRLLKEDPDRKGDTWPDLLLIDGGAGQVSAVSEILAEMGVDDIPVVGVAKGIDRDAGKEEFHRPASAPSPCNATTRSSTSSSACAMKPTAGPTAPTGPSAPKPSAPRPWTKSPASAPPANAPFWPISAAPRPSRAPPCRTCWRLRASRRPWRKIFTDFSTAPTDAGNLAARKSGQTGPEQPCRPVMHRQSALPSAETGREVPFTADELIYSRTDSRGVIQAANTVFRRLSGFDWPDLIGAPHRIIRHPDMPKGFFHIFWDQLKKGEPAVGYVKNRCSDGRHYWVLANAIPCRAAISRSG